MAKCQELLHLHNDSQSKKSILPSNPTFQWRYVPSYISSPSAILQCSVFTPELLVFTQLIGKRKYSQVFA